MAGRLKDKVAIITGAGQGIGAATAQRFVEEGAAVVIAELNEKTGTATAARLREQGHRAIAIQTDVADPASVNRMVEQAVEQLGPPDILVNNAGIAVFDEPMKLTDEQWRRCFAVDLDGVWYCTRAVLPYMLERNRGSVVNIASVHSFQIIPHCFPYPVAKHGVIGLTRALAVEYGNRNIRVNAICPSYIDTQVNIDYLNTFPDPEAERARVANLHPLKKIGLPDEVAWAVVFVASDEAGFMTGASLMVDGGLSVLYHDV
jgi:NAD(P)-dependent dehydrogenase (short-subunit alcohol dehydrogenase family)